jgi:hypothetical protein
VASTNPTISMLTVIWEACLSSFFRNLFWAACGAGGPRTARFSGGAQGVSGTAVRAHFQA